METYGKRAVLHLGHPNDEYEAVTEMQKNEIYPFFEKQIQTADKLVLDLGCGLGRFTADLAEMIHGKALGIDVVQDFFEMAPRAEKVRYLPMRKETEIPLPDAYVDIVWICLVLGGVQDKKLEKLVNEIKRVLKDGGLLFLIENTTAKESGGYWKFRSIERYLDLFSFVNLKHLHDYYDMSERISIMAGRKRN